MKFLPLVQRMGADFLDVAFPASCASCGDALENSPLPHLCYRCFSKIHIVEDPRCLTCGYPFFGDAYSHEDCQHCSRLTPKFSRGWSITLFRGPIRRLIYALKYERAFWALGDLGRIAEYAEGLGDYLDDAILVPVPLHSRKFRERGYNQSALIAEELSKRFEVDYREDLLARVVDTQSQTRFNRQDRYRNLKNAFASNGKTKPNLKSRHVIVDDVFTTGSTLNACAAALRKSGVKEVDVLTIGHG